MSPKKSLTATNLAIYQQLDCDLYIHNVYNDTGSSGPHAATASPSELSKAHFKRGLDWEAYLYSWLDASQLLLKVPSVPLDGPSSLLENILADDRKHFFITGLSFWPPKAGLADRFSSFRNEPLTFGLAKPDLLEIKQTDTGIYWRVIDAKASKHVKTSHHIQIYFYTLCLNYLLTQPHFRNADSAGIWLAPQDGFDVFPPSMDDIKTITISLLSPTLDTLLFRDLPKIISKPVERVKWHYNPLCRGCRFESECRPRAQAQGELGSMPNISIDDAKTLQDLLRISRVSSIPNSGVRLPDIEELHQLVGNTTKFETIAKSSPIIVKRAKHILGLPKKTRMQNVAAYSPAIEAVRRNNVQIIPRRNFTCPQQEDVAIVLSVVNDPSSPNSNGDYFCVTTHCKIANIVLPTSILCSASAIIVELAGLLRLVDAVLKDCGSPCTSQFYVWSSSEQSLLQTHIINAALTSTSNDQDIRMCIGALAQGASLLQTTFQPILLSGALLKFLGKGKLLKAEYKACLERMGLSSEGTVEILKKRVDNEVRRLQESTAPGYQQRRKELGQLPRVVVLKKEIERQLALPIPGYWDLPECISILLPGAEACPSEEQIFAAYKDPRDAHELGKLLLRRNTCVFYLLNELRNRALSTNGTSLLVNDAKILSTQFMDLCRETHIRKLFFMQQFEVLTKLSELWQARIDACPEAPTLEFCNVIQGINGVEYVFRLVSGAVDVPSSDRDYAFYDKLLVLDTPGVSGMEDSVPVEALFDDLGVSGLVFPLNRYTRASWYQQHGRVQNELLLADVRNVYADRDRPHTLVSLRTWGTATMKFEKGAIYRLSPRLIDFNTAKVLSSLFEIDLHWGSEEEFYEDDNSHPHRDIPFLQLIVEPTSLGKVAVARHYVKIEREIQKLFRDLKDLGNSVAGTLVLKASQHTATQRILSNRLSVIWGPPGESKIRGSADYY
uniref:Uncharacterized protein n=1 Tax=Psilocybe cubensis TaxID=181762 RepID=A0A8H7Y8C3_PSICU